MRASSLAVSTESAFSPSEGPPKASKRLIENMLDEPVRAEADVDVWLGQEAEAVRNVLKVWSKNGLPKRQPESKSADSRKIPIICSEFGHHAADLLFVIWLSQPSPHST